ncbi:MAG: hypothetical protein IPO88_22735 [Nannocystis sp.]|uniref:hypothetical protein n=1 Tax=Nannocystis sp. TaxID=1962667 RepID=UPI0024254DDC|nr:hypothetical protein [Nannocystis sp.]MBK9756259.1 hypothetical protein [Nannocystis sp.]
MASTRFAICAARALSDGRELLRIDGEQTEGEQDNRADIACSMATQSAHLCVRTPGSGEPAKCVLEVPLQIEGRQQALGDGVTKAPPPKIERARFELTIAADGRVSTKLVGAPPPWSSQNLGRWLDAQGVVLAPLP